MSRIAGQGRGGFGATVAAFVAALMLVLSGASHELLHADEPGGPETVQAHAPAPAPAPLVAEATGKADLHGARIHACSGHCAAHAATQPPALVATFEPRAEAAVWRVAAAVSARGRQPEAADHPPRA